MSSSFGRTMYARGYSLPESIPLLGSPPRGDAPAPARSLVPAPPRTEARAAVMITSSLHRNGVWPSHQRERVQWMTWSR